MLAADSVPVAVFSGSTVSQANPARAMNRAAVTLPSDSQVPTAGLPARSICLTAFGGMQVPRAVLYTPRLPRATSPVPLVRLPQPLLDLGVDLLHLGNWDAV